MGKRYPLIEDYDEITGTGKIKIGSEVWKVEDMNGDRIKKGQMVTVKDIEGTTMLVVKYKEKK